MPKTDSAGRTAVPSDADRLADDADLANLAEGVEVAAAGPRSVLPWELRLGDWLGLSAFALGASVAGLLVAAFLAFMWLFGFPLSGPGSALNESARDSINLALLVGYAFAALHGGAAGIDRDLERAGVAGSPGPGFPEPVVRQSRFVGAAGIVIGILIVSLFARAAGEPATTPWTSIGDFSFLVGLVLAMLWLIGRAAVFTIHGSRFAAGASAYELEVHLLDLRPLQRFGRIGLRFALLWIVGVTIAAPLLLGPTLEIPPLLGAFAVTGALATAALLIPMLGVRRQICAAKSAELERVTAAIEGDASALAGTHIGGRATPPSLADLIAYRSLVESVSEWPYDTPTLSRFGLYLLIPLASWIAAALVERFVDSALG